MSQNREIDVVLFASLDYFEKVCSGDNVVTCGRERLAANLDLFLIGTDIQYFASHTPSTLHCRGATTQIFSIPSIGYGRIRFGFGC